MLEPTPKPLTPDKYRYKPVGTVFDDSIPIFIYEDVLEEIIDFSEQVTTARNRRLSHRRRCTKTAGNTSKSGGSFRRSAPKAGRRRSPSRTNRGRPRGRKSSRSTQTTTSSAGTTRTRASAFSSRATTCSFTSTTSSSRGKSPWSSIRRRTSSASSNGATRRWSIAGLCVRIRRDRGSGLGAGD